MPLLKRLLIDNWQRKLISLIVAMVIWMVVHNSIQKPPNSGGIQETSFLHFFSKPHSDGNAP